MSNNKNSVNNRDIWSDITNSVGSFIKDASKDVASATDSIGKSIGNIFIKTTKASTNKSNNNQENGFVKEANYASNVSRQNNQLSIKKRLQDMDVRQEKLKASGVSVFRTKGLAHSALSDNSSNTSTSEQSDSSAA